VVAVTFDVEEDIVVGEEGAMASVWEGNTGDSDIDQQREKGKGRGEI
jgi:hypothetical protein